MYHGWRSPRCLALLTFILCLIGLNLLAFSQMTIRHIRPAAVPIREQASFEVIDLSKVIVHDNSSESMGSKSIPKPVAPESSAPKPLKFPKDSLGAMYPGGHDVAIPDKCLNKGEGIDLVIVVTSEPSRLKARTAIRQTWGSFGSRPNLRVFFILGRTEDTKLERLLQDEQKLHDDMIRGRFHDSYSNLTLKTISSLEWFDTYCSAAKFLLKTDDDMFINVPRLVSFAKKHEADRNVIFGLRVQNSQPIRDKNSKWYASLEQYKPTVYPDYTIGAAYLLPTDIIHKLYETALREPFLRIEDVFTTGVVAQKLKIKRVYANEFWNQAIAYTACNVQRYISIHGVLPREQYDLWKKLFDENSKC
ncbi:beta-1,3-galactosyltransferase 5 [Diachasma alloeum]|uniref:beta-1,3-galactosyltransferase 5 n=1 Tax=Diachasma alloeum TaxID=454923 RepID=UPI0007383C24|nr:beta-1,3-galactosyltransferase 5 [Diachasma alloeum]XP_015111302.1 beta-1,3-galactosyltransferase 5 [Diachasma alloeum]